jgi:hypothetical protein
MPYNDYPLVINDLVDIELGHFFAAHPVDGANEFHLNKLSIFCSKRQVFVTNCSALPDRCVEVHLCFGG